MCVCVCVCVCVCMYLFVCVHVMCLCTCECVVCVCVHVSGAGDETMGFFEFHIGVNDEERMVVHHPSSFDRAWEAYSMLKGGLCLGLAGQACLSACNPPL